MKRNICKMYRMEQLWIVGSLLLCLTGCGTKAASGGEGVSGQAPAAQIETASAQAEYVSEQTVSEQTEAGQRVALSYAQDFTLDRYDNGCTLIGISDGTYYLVVPEELEDIPDEELKAGVSCPGAVTLLRQPVDQIYLVASAVMDMFCELDGLSSIRLSGTDAEGWYIEEARAAMEAGDILYAGKYNAPDYELILSEGCKLAVENTMISHSPEVKENLIFCGIPVLVDYSSYESHPLGRVEWIKVYGALLGREEEAERIFAAQEALLLQVEEELAQAEGNAAGSQDGRPAVAFFYITNNGAANVRRPSDYVPKMIELAGGAYIYHDPGEEESRASSMTMQIEEFYATAKDADYIIYNSAIDGEVGSLEELYAKCGLLADFKAVKEGNVYCTTKNLYQESMSVGGLIQDIHVMLTQGKEGQMEYLYPVE